MNRTLTRLALTICAVVALTTGCTSTKPYRTSYTPCNPAQGGPDCAKAVIESTPDYKLGFVEIDDQGWFQNPRQLKAVEQMIRTETGIGQTNDAQSTVMVVFVHGWKNNASCDNSNVAMFRTTLQQLNKYEQIQTNHAARKVVGVYVGWRGLSLEIPYLDNLSFWERKNTAHKVGGYGALTELLVDLESLQQTNNNLLAANVPRSELIIVGHSFGGGAVYSALSQIITERFAETIKNGQPLKPLGDQVILLNPAFEASRHYDLNQMALSIQQYPTNQRPVLSIFTSKGDWATHYAFPIGRFFSTIFQKNRDKQQRVANRDAVGWFKPFITHDLVYNTNAPALANGTSTLKPKKKKPEIKSREQLQASISNVSTQRKQWHLNKPIADTYYFDESILKPRAGYRPGDPFLIVSVDKKIMKDHGDIANPVLINFLGDYILFCQSDTPGHPK